MRPQMSFWNAGEIAGAVPGSAGAIQELQVKLQVHLREVQVQFPELQVSGSEVQVSSPYWAGAIRLLTGQFDY